MNKEIFLNRLERLLRSLKKDERNRFLSYYCEMIDDYVEDGCTEEEAVKRIGNPGEIAQEILADKESENSRPVSGGMKILIVTLLILGCPLWGSLVLAGLSLALAAGILILSAYVVIWCIPLMTGALSISSIILAVVSMVGGVILMFQNKALGVMQMGSGIFFAGMFILAGIVTWELGRIFVKVTVRFSKWLYGIVSRKIRGARV